jgi:hypothetical protein
MQEINVYGIEMAVSHLCFYAYGGDDRTVGIIIPTENGINIVRECIINHFQLLRRCDIRRTTVREIELESRSKILIACSTDRVFFTGHSLDMVFSIGQALTMEQKGDICPRLSYANGNIYNVYTEEDNPPPETSVKKWVCNTFLELID